MSEHGNESQCLHDTGAPHNPHVPVHAKHRKGGSMIYKKAFGPLMVPCAVTAIYGMAPFIIMCLELTGTRVLVLKSHLWLNMVGAIAAFVSFVVVLVVSISGIKNSREQQVYDRAHYAPFLRYSIVSFGFWLLIAFSITFCWVHFSQVDIDLFNDFSSARSTEWLDITSMFRTIAGMLTVGYVTAIVYMFSEVVHQYMNPLPGRAYMELPIQTAVAESAKARGEQFEEGNF